MVYWLVLVKHQSPFLENSAFPPCLVCMKSMNLIKQKRLIRKSNNVFSVLYEQAVTIEEIKASLRDVCTSVFFLSKVLFG